MDNIKSFEDYELELEGFIFEYEDVDASLIEEMNNESKDYERTDSGKIKYRDEIFPGFNKPKSYKKGTHGNGDYKKRVLAKEGDEIKVVNFGHRDYSDYTKHKDPKRRKNFRARHGCDKGKLSKTTAKYWACNNLW